MRWNYLLIFRLFRSQDYIVSMENKHADQGKTLSYFELNLETWRQLWRVLEISDIILVIVDARYPVRFGFCCRKILSEI